MTKEPFPIEMRVKALQALHAYEALTEIEDDYEEAAMLRDHLYDLWSNAWEELAPILNR